MAETRNNATYILHLLQLKKKLKENNWPLACINGLDIMIKYWGKNLPEEEIKKLFHFFENPVNVYINKNVYNALQEETKEAKNEKLERIGLLCGEEKENNYFIKKMIKQRELEELLNEKVEAAENKVSTKIINSFLKKYPNNDVIADYHTHPYGVTVSRMDVAFNEQFFGKINLFFISVFKEEKFYLIPYQVFSWAERTLKEYTENVKINIV